MTITVHAKQDGCIEIAEPMSCADKKNTLTHTASDDFNLSK